MWEGLLKLSVSCSPGSVNVDDCCPLLHYRFQNSDRISKSIICAFLKSISSPTTLNIVDAERQVLDFLYQFSE